MYFDGQFRTGRNAVFMKLEVGRATDSFMIKTEILGCREDCHVTDLPRAAY